MRVEKVKQEARAEATVTFANEQNSMGFFVDLPPLSYPEASSHSLPTPQTIIFTEPSPSPPTPGYRERWWIRYYKDIITITRTTIF